MTKQAAAMTDQALIRSFEGVMNKRVISFLAVAVPSQLERLLERAENALLDLGRKGRVPRVIHQRASSLLLNAGVS